MRGSDALTCVLILKNKTIAVPSSAQRHDRACVLNFLKANPSCKALSRVFENQSWDLHLLLSEDMNQNGNASSQPSFLSNTRLIIRLKQLAEKADTSVFDSSCAGSSSCAQRDDALNAISQMSFGLTSAQGALAYLNLWSDKTAESSYVFDASGARF